jgi:polar amino acid transport system permease protein
VDWSVLWQYREELASGLAITLAISAAGIVGATVLGVLVGCLATSRSYLLQKLTGSYTSLLRNLPLLVKLVFLYYVASLGPLTAAIVALVLHQSAPIADVVASGIRSVAVGQFDAALALGLRPVEIFRRIILPQTVRVILPPMTTQYASIVKNSAVVSLIGVADLTFQTQEINVQTFRGFEAATAATVLYAAVTFLVIVVMSRRAQAQ